MNVYDSRQWYCSGIRLEGKFCILETTMRSGNFRYEFDKRSTIRTLCTNDNMSSSFCFRNFFEDQYYKEINRFTDTIQIWHAHRLHIVPTITRYTTFAAMNLYLLRSPNDVLFRLICKYSRHFMFDSQFVFEGLFSWVMKPQDVDLLRMWNCSSSDFILLDLHPISNQMVLW